MPIEPHPRLDMKDVADVDVDPSWSPNGGIADDAAEKARSSAGVADLGAREHEHTSTQVC